MVSQVNTLHKSSTPIVEMAIVSGSAAAKKRLVNRMVEPIDNSGGIQDFRQLRDAAANSVLSSIAVDKRQTGPTILSPIAKVAAGAPLKKKEPQSESRTFLKKLNNHANIEAPFVMKEKELREEKQPNQPVLHLQN